MVSVWFAGQLPVTDATLVCLAHGPLRPLGSVALQFGASEALRHWGWMLLICRALLRIRAGAGAGSKDVGVDPDWDLKTGTYKKAGTSFNPSEEDVAKFRRQHGMRDPLEVERLLKERRAAKAGASRTE